MKQSLRDKRVVVTGGTSGIGEAVCRRFMSDGAHVIALGLTDAECAAAQRDMPDLVAALAVDVADPEAVDRAFARVDEQFSGLDTLINNAGTSLRHPFLEIAVTDWQRVVDVNLNGMFYCAQQAARRMIGGAGGCIAMTASTNGMVAHPLYADYNAAKAGVISLTKTMALELAPTIRVNCICPGYVMTPMQRAEYTPEMLEATDRLIPLGRHATPEEIAALFAFLASDEAKYITGAAIPIDAGETAGGLASRRWG